MTKARPWGTIELTKAGDTSAIILNRGQNSLGEDDVFAGKSPAGGKPEFKELRGFPLYAIQTWAVGHGYTYKVND